MHRAKRLKIPCKKIQIIIHCSLYLTVTRTNKMFLFCNKFIYLSLLLCFISFIFGITILFTNIHLCTIYTARDEIPLSLHSETHTHTHTPRDCFDLYGADLECSRRNKYALSFFDTEHQANIETRGKFVHHKIFILLNNKLRLKLTNYSQFQYNLKHLFLSHFSKV